MSQVRNLRAMFEQKGDSTPPERGRVLPLAAVSESPRPLSRVRTNFIAVVEKDGRVGLQRDPSTDSALSTNRKASGGSEGEAITPALSRQSTLNDGESRGAATPPAFALGLGARLKIAETTPTPPAPSATSATSAPTALLAASIPTPVATPKRGVATDEKEAEHQSLHGKPAAAAADTPKGLFGKALTKAVPSDAETVSSVPKGRGAQTATSAPKHANPTPNGSNRAVLKPANGVPKVTADVSGHGSAAPTPSPAVAKTTKENGKDVPRANTTAASSRNVPKAISVAKPNSLPATQKSPTVALKTPTSPMKPLAARHTYQTPEKKTVSPAVEKPTSHGTPKSAVSSSAGAGGRSRATSSATKPPLANLTFPPNGIGFVKPKPKSPTRPVALPPSLMTHTASSATKINAPRQSLSRLSGNYLQVHQPLLRSPSRASISTVASAATGATRSLKRQNSTINRPRPSIGPPPKQPARDYPIAKREKEVDASFLARMMRPTQASASKTADKAPATPPRKQVASKAAKRPEKHTPDHSVPHVPVPHVVDRAPKARESTTIARADQIYENATYSAAGVKATPMSEDAPSSVPTEYSPAVIEDETKTTATEDKHEVQVTELTVHEELKREPEAETNTLEERPAEVAATDIATPANGSVDQKEQDVEVQQTDVPEEIDQTSLEEAVASVATVVEVEVA